MPFEKSLEIVVEIFCTSLAIEKMTPSSRLYCSEPVVKFSEPTYAVVPSTTIVLAWM